MAQVEVLQPRDNLTLTTVVVGGLCYVFGSGLPIQGLSVPRGSDFGRAIEVQTRRIMAQAVKEKAGVRGPDTG